MPKFNPKFIKIIGTAVIAFLITLFVYGFVLLEKRVGFLETRPVQVMTKEVQVIVIATPSARPTLRIPTKRPVATVVPTE